MKTIAVIPARLASTRLPRKMLRQIAGQMLLGRVYEGVRSSPLLSDVIVATDSDEIMQVCRQHGWNARMTSPAHRSGTERVREISDSVAADVYLNIQGDEPLTRAEHIAALLKLALGPEPPAPVGGPDLRARLSRTLRNTLSDPRLCPASVAAEHRISVRTLHYAFAAAGTTFVEELMQARLQRARELLADPRERALPVIEVAARCGFTDPSHFARRFRRRFGIPPLAFRQAAADRP